MPRIETERLLLRPLVMEDVEGLARLWTDPVVTLYMGGARDYDSVRASFEAEARAAPLELDLWPVIEKESHRLAGHCGFLPKRVNEREEVDLNYIFAVEYWGRGYATEMAQALLKYAPSITRNLRLIALIDPAHEASQRVARKIGMLDAGETIRPSGRRMRIFAIDL